MCNLKLPRVDVPIPTLPYERCISHPLLVNSLETPPQYSVTFFIWVPV